jgi:hypothetical protein
MVAKVVAATALAVLGTVKALMAAKGRGKAVGLTP